jgi:hypothetical protein
MMSLKAMDLQKEREHIKYDRHYWLVGCMIKSPIMAQGFKGQPRALLAVR